MDLETISAAVAGRIAWLGHGFTAPFKLRLIQKIHSNNMHDPKDVDKQPRKLLRYAIGLEGLGLSRIERGLGSAVLRGLCHATRCSGGLRN